MFSRWLPLVVVALVGTETTAALAQKSGAPTVVVRVRSLDTVLENARTIVGLVGQEELGRQFEGLVRAKIGEQGLEGIDTKRPIGAYVNFGKELEDTGGVLMVPIASEKAFLDLLDNLNFKPTQDANGIYTIRTGAPVDISFRFANQYAYFTSINLETLAPGKLQAPAKIFSGKQDSAISATVRLDQLPEAAKLLMHASLEAELNKIRDKKEPSDTKALKAFRAEALKEIAKLFSTVLEDGAEVTAEIDLNRDTKEFTARWSLTAQPGTKLTKVVADLGKSTSLFAGLKGSDSTVAGLVHLALPPAVRQSFEELIDESTAKALDNLRDEKKKKQAEALIQSLVPSLKAGELDAGFEMTGPGADKHYTVVAGIKLKEGDKLAKTLRDLLSQTLDDLPPQARDLIKLDADSVDSIKIHRIDVGQFFDPKTSAVFGSSPVHLALRDDALFISVGENGLAAIKKALVSKAGATHAAFSFEVAVARLLPLMTKLSEPPEAAQRLFAGDDGRIRVTIEAGASLSAKISANMSVLQFLGGYAGKKLKLN